MKRLVALVAALCLAACFADLDWRELHSEQGRFSAWLPARASEEARTLPGSGAHMRQWSARARDTIFAVGYADFPGATQGRMQELRDAIVRNIDGKIESEHAIRSADAAGIEVAASGRSGNSALALRLRLYERGARVYQLAVLGAPDAVTPTDVDTFFGSFRLDR
jgi:hypothetical protein